MTLAKMLGRERAFYASLLLVTADFAPDERPATKAGEIVELINAGEAEVLHGRLSSSAAYSLSPTKVQNRVERIAEKHGVLLDIAPIDVTSHAGTFHVHTGDGDLKLELEVDDDGLIEYFGLTEIGPPFARSIPLGLPVRGRWYVGSGGCDPHRNRHHAASSSQRCAADLSIRGADKRTHRGAGRDNRDYYAHGQDIVAMADGVVVTVIDGVPENVPGEKNEAFVSGNAVVVRHDADVHSLYLHLIPGSPRVEPGDIVHRGQLLGKCGNSGRSSQPHLHVQVQDGFDFGKSWGMDAVFDEVVVDREGEVSRMTDYVFRTGDEISSPDQSSSSR